MKNKNFKRALVCSLFFLSGAPAAFADTGDIGLGMKGGTLGIGGEVTAGITPSFNARVGYNGYTYSGNTTESHVAYDYKLKLKSLPILLDWHPFDNSGFRLSGGMVINNNEVTATGTTQSTYTIGNTTYTGAQLGSLTGRVDFNNVAPYAGIGWGNAVGKDTGLSFSFNLGVIFQGSPKVTLAANGPIVNDPLLGPAFQTNLAQEQRDVQSKIDNLKYYPELSLGLAYKF